MPVHQGPRGLRCPALLFSRHAAWGLRLYCALPRAPPALAVPTSRPTDPDLDADALSVQQELLRLLARQGRRVPFPVGLSAAAIALMASAGLGPALPLAWLTLVFAVLALRWWILGRLPAWHDRSMAQRLNWAVALSGLNGLVFAASFGFSPWMVDHARMLQTILLLGLCAGAVATTAGHRPVFLAFLLPMSLANSLAWALQAQRSASAWLEWLLAALILAFAWILAGLARDTYKVFADSVLIRQQQLRSNERLRQALQRAETANRAKTRFFASASHDLRQPLHTLSLLGAALSLRTLEPASQKIVGQMNQALESLASQMDALLDVSKLDAQVLELNEQRFALAPWLARLAQEFGPAAQRKGLALALDCPPEAHVLSDPALLERVLRNLLDNAIKYTASGGVRIHVRAAELGGERRWEIAVIDSGLGIAPSEQSRVFEEFYQVGNLERDRAQGLGLGLSIVSRLVDLLEVQLRLESEPGCGSVFTLSLVAVEPLEPSALAGEGPRQHRLAGLRVLVLDDEQPVREAMQALLSAHGCEVRLAATTRAAVLDSLAAPPDLVLADLRLRSGDDGIAAIQSLRSALPDLPALLISGDTAPERLRQVEAAGLLLLHKPVQASALLDAIERLLARRYPGLSNLAS